MDPASSMTPGGAGPSNRRPRIRMLALLIALPAVPVGCTR
jgi:hypothetical protein